MKSKRPSQMIVFLGVESMDGSRNFGDELPEPIIELSLGPTSHRTKKTLKIERPQFPGTQRRRPEIVHAGNGNDEIFRSTNVVFKRLAFSLANRSLLL